MHLSTVDQLRCVEERIGELVERLSSKEARKYRGPRMIKRSDAAIRLVEIGETVAELRTELQSISPPESTVSL